MTAVNLSAIPQQLPMLQPRIDGGLQTTPETGPSQAVPFASWLSEAVANYQAHETSAVYAGQEFAAGRLDDIHGTMIALKEADIELRVLANVRNKMVDAFNELMRMSV